ncbi:MAG: hypothetical protein PVSMB4_12070 [Ktedonobacterales bacterium]
MPERQIERVNADVQRGDRDTLVGPVHGRRADGTVRVKVEMVAVWAARTEHLIAAVGVRSRPDAGGVPACVALSLRPW